MYRLGHQLLLAAVGIAGTAVAVVFEGRGELRRADLGMVDRARRRCCWCGAGGRRGICYESDSPRRRVFGYHSADARARGCRLHLQRWCPFDGVSFSDCQISCAASGPRPDTFTCGAEGLCRAQGASGTCAAVLDANLDTGGSSDASTDGGGNAASGIYVSNVEANQILVYALDASGIGCAAADDLWNAATMLATPLGLAFDGSGNLYVANGERSTTSGTVAATSPCIRPARPAATLRDCASSRRQD